MNANAFGIPNELKKDRTKLKSQGGRVFFFFFNNKVILIY